MANRLTNAGFLDQAEGWTASAPLTLSIDETVRGDAGRLVLRGAGNASGDAQTATVQPATASRPAVVAGDMVEVHGAVAAFIAGVAATPTVRLVFRDVVASQISAASLDLRAPALTLHGLGRHGLADTFHRFHARLPAPVGAATATIDAAATAPTAGQSIEIALLRPFLDILPAGRADPLPWDPGVHGGADLQLEIWPQVLRPFQRGSGAEPRPDRVEFDTGPGRGASRRTSLDPARRFDGTMRCDAVQRAALEAFHRSDPGDFWFVEPDSGRLCVASFAADGAPRATEARGPTVIMSVGLWLETF